MNPEIFESKFIMNEATWQRIERLVNTEDDIGLVLRVHLITEAMIEAFCCAAVGNQNLFDGFGENLTMTYAAKFS